MTAEHPRLIVGISGASGAVYGVRLLQALRKARVESHLVITRAGQMTLTQETSLKLADIAALADHVYGDQDIGAAISSGSFATSGMIVAAAAVFLLLGNLGQSRTVALAGCINLTVSAVAWGQHVRSRKNLAGTRPLTTPASSVP